MAARRCNAGQTRNLMRRMQEHCAGTTKTTRGRRPALAWFEQVASRQLAVEKEADLKYRIDTAPDGVRGMVAAFRGQVRCAADWRRHDRGLADDAGTQVRGPSHTWGQRWAR